MLPEPHPVLEGRLASPPSFRIFPNATQVTRALSQLAGATGFGRRL